MTTQKHSFKVEMSCSGCSGAVERNLKKLQGIDLIDISLENQTVEVTTSLPKETIFEAIKKTGKPVTPL